MIALLRVGKTGERRTEKEEAKYEEYED